MIVVVVHLSRETVMLLVIWVNVVLDIAITRRLVIGVVEGELKDAMTFVPCVLPWAVCYSSRICYCAYSNFDFIEQHSAS